MHIDWGDIAPTDHERQIVELALEPLSELTHERVELRRRGSGYEAQVALDLLGRTTRLKLHAESLPEVIERVAELVYIVIAHRPLPLRDMRRRKVTP